jgi:hypothetical protein
VYAALELLGEGVMDEPMAIDTTHSFERVGDDRDLEMSLGATGNIVLDALVLDDQSFGCEPLAQLVFDPSL